MPNEPETNNVSTDLPDQSAPITPPEQITPIAPSTSLAKQAQAKKSNKTALIVSLIVAAVLLLGSGIGGGLTIAQLIKPNAQPSLTSASDGNTTVTQEESSIAAVAEKVGPSVVSIVTQTRSQSYLGGSTSSEAAGTGIIVSKDGYVMTNNHVLEGATSVSVIDSEGELYENVKIIGRDPLNDVAFLKISANKDFTAAQLGNSSTIRTGQQVVAIGNALGQYSSTVTSGIISGTARTITADTGSGDSETLTDLIQTDASINPGNSGGPLVNMSGQIIGINTAIVQDANGIGFAIPINATKGILAGVLEKGTISRGYLGVQYVTITPDTARQYKLNVTSGSYIYASGANNPVVSGGPADKAGLKAGDIITKVNDETVGTQGSLSSILGEYRPGDKITLTILRDGKEQTLTAILDAYKG